MYVRHVLYIEQVKDSVYTESHLMTIIEANIK